MKISPFIKKVIILFCLVFPGGNLFSQDKPRTIITTDGEVDDIDSFIRFLLYTNEVNVEGLIYSSSQWHYAGDGKGTMFTSQMPFTARRYGTRTSLRWAGTEWIQMLIGKYGEVYENLTQHAKGYPTPEYLLNLVHVGNIDFEGEMEKVTDGSEFIKNKLLDDDQRPLYLQIWGGTNTVARALKSIEEQYKDTPQWRDVYKKVCDKAIIYAVLDQDMTYKRYVSQKWPDVKMFYNSAQFWSFAYFWPMVVPDALKPFMEGPWFQENILTGHGPLLDEYYTWGDGKQVKGDEGHTNGLPNEAQQQGRKKFDFLSEGDSPAYFQLIDVGLRNLNDPSVGGWGGRLVRSKDNPNRWEDGKHVADMNPYTHAADTAYAQTRWIEAIQNDFAARADWMVMGFKKANHAPVPKLNMSQDLIVKPGSTIKLSGSAKDPDGNTITYRWWQYEEVDSYGGKIAITNPSKSNASFIVPADAITGNTIHIILEVTDSGRPRITRYQRVIATVKK